jgi:hypothetical protein
MLERDSTLLADFHIVIPPINLLFGPLGETPGERMPVLP